MTRQDEAEVRSYRQGVETLLSSAAQVECGGVINSLPLLHTHNWNMSWLLVWDTLVEGIAVGNVGISIELDSSLISPASDLSWMSFNESVFMAPALDSKTMPDGPRTSRELVGDSNL